MPVRLSTLVFLIMGGGQVFYFPHYSDGGGFATEFVVSNGSSERVTGTFSVYDASGRLAPLPFDTGDSGRIPLDLAPRSSLVLKTRGDSNPPRSGYVEVNSDSDALSGLAIFRSAAGAEAAVLPVSAGREFSLYVERSDRTETGLAISRTGLARVRMELFDLDGQPVDARDYEPPAAFQEARYLYQLLRVPASFRGSLRLASADPFAPVGLRLGALAMTAVPVARLDGSDAAGATYYVDAAGGDDGGNGLSPGTAWKSLDAVNRRIFGPGDRILFRAGLRWSGQLKPQGSGRAGAPVVVDRFGEGANPAIDAQGKTLEAVLLHNVEQWELNNLEITNTGPAPVARRKGVMLNLSDFGTAHHIVLRNLYVHDVNGSNVKDAGGGSGIGWTNGGDRVRSRFDDLLIENCRLVRTDRNGIVGGSAYWRRDRWHPSLNVVIRGNLLEDIGGDGIVPIGCDGALVERNTLRGGRRRAEDYAAGIWPWSCDNTVVQFNEVSGMRGTKDGQGFDSDWNCRNSLFQYNYSHNNDGGFMLICNNGTQSASLSAGNTGTVVRYNISQNDGARTFHFAGPVRDTLIYNNTFYVGSGMDILAVLHSDWGGFSEGTRLLNNIFHVDGRVRYDFAGSRDNGFSNNAFFGNHVSAPADPAAVTSDPMLEKPGSGGDGLESLSGYRLRAASPCISAGIPVPGNGGRDFWGNPVPAAGKPDIGAHAPSR